MTWWGLLMTDTIPSLNQFWKMLQSHDWTYEYSDDGSVWRRGQQQLDAIRAVVEHGTDEHKELFNQWSEYAWGKSKQMPVMPMRTKEEQLADCEMIHFIAEKLDDIVSEIYSIQNDQVVSAEQLWKLVNPASSILYKLHELAAEKNEGAMKNTVATKGYKKIQEQLAPYCER
jgi:hypothetical protein